MDQDDIRTEESEVTTEAPQSESEVGGEQAA